MNETTRLFKDFISLALAHPEGPAVARAFDRTLQFDLADGEPFYLELRNGALTVNDGDSGLDWKYRDWRRATCVHTTGRVLREIAEPTVARMREEGTPLSGILYVGLMLTADGPKVLEYNVRFGDPETQAVLPRLRSDLLDLLLRATRPGGLAGAALEWDPRAAVTVVLASGGYPASSSSGDEITGLERVPAGIEVTHAGTAERDGAIVTAGGRVLNVTALGDGVPAARAAAYAAADVIKFDGRQLRRDIAA